MLKPTRATTMRARNRSKDSGFTRKMVTVDFEGPNTYSLSLRGMRVTSSVKWDRAFSSPSTKSLFL
eukprot:30700_4